MYLRTPLGAIQNYTYIFIFCDIAITNNDPGVVAKYLLEYICLVGGAPHIVRGDHGTENVNMAAIQRFFRREEVDAFAGDKSFMCFNS